MKDFFKGYVPQTASEEKKLWSECEFVFDSNIYLSLYSHSPHAREQILTTIEGLKTRIWVPYQVLSEFRRTRPRVMESRRKLMDVLEDKVGQAFDTLRNAIQSVYEDELGVDIELIKTLDESKESLESKVKAYVSTQKVTTKSDEVLPRLIKALEGRTGAVHEAEWIKNVERAGDSRYKNQVPPGYKDNSKKESESEPGNAFGDLIIWFEMIDHAKSAMKPIVFVTNDRKEDWFGTKYAVHSEAPRAELIQEFFDKTSLQFYAYPLAIFLEKEKHMIGKGSSDSDTINEVRTAASHLRALRPDPSNLFGAFAGYPDLLRDPVALMAVENYLNAQSGNKAVLRDAMLSHPALTRDMFGAMGVAAQRNMSKHYYDLINEWILSPHHPSLQPPNQDKSETLLEGEQSPMAEPE